MRFGRFLSFERESDKIDSREGAGHIANPDRGGEIDPGAYRNVEISYEIDGLMKKMTSGEGYDKYDEQKLQTLKDELQKELKRLTKDYEGQKASGTHSGILNALEDEIRDREALLKQADEILNPQKSHN